MMSLKNYGPAKSWPPFLSNQILKMDLGGDVAKSGREVDGPFFVTKSHGPRSKSHSFGLQLTRYRHPYSESFHILLTNRLCVAEHFPNAEAGKGK
jgi:hypothetical protein